MSAKQELEPVGELVPLNFVNTVSKGTHWVRYDAITAVYCESNSSARVVIGCLQLEQTVSQSVDEVIALIRKASTAGEAGR